MLDPDRGLLEALGQAAGETLGDLLVQAALEAVLGRLRNTRRALWVTAVPSLRSPVKFVSTR